MITINLTSSPALADFSSRPTKFQALLGSILEGNPNQHWFSESSQSSQPDSLWSSFSTFGKE
jgi:hypothetical protein